MKNTKAEKKAENRKPNETRSPKAEHGGSSALAAVAQILNLPYCRFSTRSARQGSKAAEQCARPADWKSAIGSFAPAHSALRALPSLRSGNSFRRLPDGSSQQTPSLRYVALVAFCLLAAGLSLPASAQNYSIDWHTIDGGGGTSTGGVYSVSGTIGQPDASTTPMTGGSYSLTGGFWSLIAVETPGAPTLSIVPAGTGQATISWTPDTPDFVLQETPSLSSTNWVNSPSGTNNPVTVPVPGEMKFYRLFKP